MKNESLLIKFLVWRIRYFNNKNFVLILSGFVGMISGLAAVILKESVHFIQNELVKLIKIESYVYFIFPLIGILLTVLISHFVFKETMGHGITHILYDIAKNSSIIRRTKMYSRMFTSAITVGMGGSVGLEAPIVVTGSAIGSNIGRLVHLSQKKKTLLIGCGAAAAISAIFNSPVAGVIFSMEVILVDVTIGMFIPLLISSVVAVIISLSLLGDDVLFSFRLVDSFKASETPYYIIFGIVCGLVSVYFTRVTFLIEKMLGNVKNVFLKAIIGGLCLCTIILFFPPIYGEGYDTIKLMLIGEQEKIFNKSLFFNQISDVGLFLIFMLGIVLIKPIASTLTISSGGSGGIFAPSLFLGGVTGFLFAQMINYLFGGDISTSNFTLVGMCGTMSGILYAPLTAIFLIAEITSGYELFVPLMLVSAIAFSTSSFFEKHSIYTKSLIQRGDLIQYDRDKLVLSQIDLKKIIEKDLLSIHPEATLEDLIHLVRIGKRNIFPVITDEKILVGVITLDDIRHIMFDSEKVKNTLVTSIMQSPPSFVRSDEEMQSVMNKFELTGAWNLPVIDDNIYKGFVSKSRIFNTYRKKLILANKD